MGSSDHVQNLFEEFINLRESGYTRTEAINQIQDTARQLSTENQKRLSGMLQEWERQHPASGAAYTNGTSADDPDGTSPKPPAAWDQAVQYADETRKRNVIRRIQPRGDDLDNDMAVGISCPHCQKQNQPDALYCYSCGTPLGSANTYTATRPLDATDNDNAYFGENMVLFLKIQGTGQTLRIQPRQTEMIIGRQSPDSAMFPDVDLSPHQAEQHGVSRLHAGLRRQDNTLVLTDLGSKNHTHINGQRLHAHEVRVLHDGDELRLGRMVMYVYFGEG